MTRSASLAALVISLAAAAAAEPPKTKEECLARVARLEEGVQGRKLSDDLRVRIDEELGRARRDCKASLFADADRSMQLAERLVNGEPDPD